MLRPDILVIGSGPAGARSAELLAGAGFDVVMAEKRRLPRHKTCAGGLTAKAASLLPDLPDDLVERRPDTMHMELLGESFERRTPTALIQTVSRPDFDHYLVKKAIAAGCRLLEEEEVVSLVTGGPGFQAVTAAGRLIEPRLIIGADGASGITAKQIGLRPWDRCDIGIEADIPSPAIGKPPLYIEWGLGRGTYSWIFPRRDDASLGIKGPLETAHNLMRHMKLKLAEIPDASRPRGQRIPYRLSKRPISTGRCLLVGDAAGLVDPWTGEGIGNALRSAGLASEAVAGYMHAGRGLDSYDRAVDRIVLPEMRAAAFYQRLFDLDQKHFFRLARNSDRAWRAMSGIISGNVDYGRYWPPWKAPAAYYRA